jgi:hypothetical protein
LKFIKKELKTILDGRIYFWAWILGEAKDACEGPWIYARMPYVFVR